MGLKPVYYLADFMTGDMLGPTLPLEGVRLTSSLQPGRFDASLDMRKACDSFAEAKGLLDLMRAGKATLVPVLEGLWDGGDRLTSRIMGEWWIGDIQATHSDPVVRLSGPEFAGYSKELLVTASWTGLKDPFVTVRDMIREMTRTDQTIDVTTGTAVAGFTVEVDVQKSKVSYWDAIRSLQDGGSRSFEWWIEPSLHLDGLAPYSLGRTLRLGSPDIRFDRPDVTLELTTPGTPPASLLDMSRGWSESAVATTVYGFGAGSGETQKSAYTSRSRESGEPGKSRLVTVRDALTYDQVKRATAAALRRFTPEDKVFPVVMPTAAYTPRLCEVYGFIREPSWSMPELYQGQVRCVGWSWSSSSDTYQLDLVDA